MEFKRVVVPLGKRLKYLIICNVIVASIALTACNSTQKTTIQNLEDVKWDTGNNVGDKWKDAKNQFISDGVMAESENGYYYNETLEDHVLLYFLDKKTGKSIVVCDQANCKHDSKTCPGYFGPYMHSLCYYNGYLYYVDWDENKATHLFQVDPDGHNRKDIAILCNWNEGSGVRSMQFHRDNLFYYVTGRDGLSKLYRIDMIKNEKTNLYVEKEGQKDVLTHMKFVENNVYYQIINRNSDGIDTSIIYLYNLQTNENTVLIEGEPKNSYTATKDYIYYSTVLNVQKYNIKTGETTVLLDNVKGSQLSNDGKNLYVDISKNANGEKIPREIVVLDWDNNIVDRFRVDDDLLSSICYFGGADYLFLSQRSELYYYDKSKLGTSEHNWVKSQVIN